MANSCGVERVKGGIEPIKVLIRQFPDPPQWMTGWDPLIDRHVGEQGAAALPVTSHLRWAVGPLCAGWVFQQTLKLEAPEAGIVLVMLLFGAIQR